MSATTEYLSPIRQNSCILIYDGECRFCVKSKGEIERLIPADLSGRIRFIPYQSLEAQQVLGPEYRPGQPEVAYWVSPDGRIQRGLDAMLPVLTSLPGGRLISALLSLPGTKLLARKLYGLIARNRYRWFGALSATAHSR